jgi:hypothetical protein
MVAFPSPFELHLRRRSVILPAEGIDMAWLIGRAEAMSNPERAKQKALERLRGLTEIDDPESLVVPILLDAILMVESYRGARHQISFLPELTKSVDDLLREFTILERSKEWSES